MHVGSNPVCGSKDTGPFSRGLVFYIQGRYNGGMDTYRFTLSVDVEVNAFSHEDAVDLINDVFGPGDDCGVEVTKIDIEDAE